MKRISLYILIPYIIIAASFGTAYSDIFILSTLITAIFRMIRRKNLIPAIIVVVSVIGACLSCGHSMSLCNKSFYPLLDKPITLSCTVAETPMYYPGKIRFTANMISAVCKDKSYELKGKVFVYIDGDDADISYGDDIQFKTTLSLPFEGLNTDGFSYKQYLQAQSIQTICYAKDFSVVNNGASSKCNPILLNIFRLRKSLMLKCDKYFDDDTSAFMKALLLGYKADMPDDMKEAVTQSGISHVVSVSGMHLSILMIILNFLLRKFKFRGSIILIPILNIICALFIMAFMGFTPSIKRAALMLIIANLTSMAYRENDSIQSLGFALLILLIPAPEAIGDVRLVLSAASVSGIILLNEKIHNFLKPHISTQSIRETASVTISAQIASTPFSILYFGTISVLGVVTNIIILPYIPIIMGIGIALLVSPSVFVCEFLSDGIWFMVRAVLNFADFISGFSFAQIETGFAHFVYTALLCAVMIYFIRKTIYCKNQLKNAAYFIIACAAVIFIIFPPKTDAVQITAINVGQGDCTLVEFPDGKTMLIDGGGDVGGDFDTAKSVLRPYLANRNITRIDYAVISHFHYDHCDGIINLAKDFPIGCIIAPDYVNAADATEITRVFELCKSEEIPLYLMDAGDNFSPADGVDFNVYSPDGRYTYGENDSSMVFKLSAYGKSILFTGDVEEYSKYMLTKGEYDIKADVMKVPHHGSYSLYSEEFVSAVEPDVAYICVGENNSYGHPHEKTMEIYHSKAIQTYRTDLDGTIEFIIKPDGEFYIN